MNMTSKIAKLLAKVMISAALIAFALRGVDIQSVKAQLAQADPATVAIAIVLTTAISVTHAQRWRIVLDCLGWTLRFSAAVRLVLIGYFFNQTLPSIVGGDAFRAWGAHRSEISASAAVSSVIIDRVMALASLLLMITIGLPWLFGLITVPRDRWIVLFVLAGAALGITCLLVLGRFATTLRRWRVTRLLIPVGAAARAVFGNLRSTAQAVFLTAIAYVGASYVAFLLARGIAVDLGFGNSLLLIPLVTLVTVLPISIAGWGLRESAMVVALGLIGVPAIAAFSLSVLYGLVVMAAGLPGGFIWLATWRPEPRAHTARTAPPSHS
jgi:uncharacterized protein (TIRG00374 family)